MPMTKNNVDTKSSSYDRAQSLMKTELPEYIVNIFMDTIDWSLLPKLTMK